MKKNLTLLFALLCSTFLFGQDQYQVYKNIFKKTDSLIQAGQISKIDSSVFVKASMLDKGHPAGFFEAAGIYLKKSKFNEASFLYYLGTMRYKYYCTANPNYKESEDGAMLASLKSVMGEFVSVYLRSDIDNYINILKLATAYYKNNDFVFFSRKKDKKKFDAQYKSYQELITELEANKEKYREEWKVERKTMQELINKMSK